MESICYKGVTKPPEIQVAHTPAHLKSVKSAVKSAVVNRPEPEPADDDTEIDAAFAPADPLAADPTLWWPGYHSTQDTLDDLLDIMDNTGADPSPNEYDQLLYILEMALFAHEEDVLNYAAERLARRAEQAPNPDENEFILCSEILRGMATDGVARRTRKFKKRLLEYLTSELHTSEDE